MDEIAVELGRILPDPENKCIEEWREKRQMGNI